VLAGKTSARQVPAGRRPRSSLGGGTPAQQRVPGAQGHKTVRRLLEAGLAEFSTRGLHAVSVDDVVRRAQTSHGTFYLYFSNKEDLFKALLRDALQEMKIITDEFPVVTRNEAGRAALRGWVQRFCDIYLAHAAVIRVLSQAEVVGEDVWRDGLLERVNYLISIGVRLPKDEMAERLSVILYAAFPSAELADGQACIDGK
jgi:AcrR family transcriptional regulator